MKPKVKTTTVDCCYCLTTQDVEQPPSLVKCEKCGRRFRVFTDESGGRRQKVVVGKTKVRRIA